MTPLLILDTETDGLGDKDNAPNCLEFAYILYDISSQQIVTGGHSLTVEATKISENSCFSGIKKSSLDLDLDFKTIDLAIMTKLTECCQKSSYIIGHNIQFDINVLTAYVQQYYSNFGIAFSSIFKSIKPLCTYHDFDFFPHGYEGKRTLTDMALINNIPVWKPHRAYRDCLLIADVFDSRKDLMSDVEKAIQPDWVLYAPKDYDLLKKVQNLRWSYEYSAWYTKTPSVVQMNIPIRFKLVKWDSNQLVKVFAPVTFNESEKRELIKSYGFKWNPNNKHWESMVLKTALEYFPFSVKIAN